ncbi:MAG: hypothetical protein AB1333_02245 [Patescibacteria group bacterium]
MNHRYFVTLLVLGIFAVGNLIPANFVFGAMYQNLNPTGDQTIAPASANFESGEAVWVNNTFVVRTRAGGTGTLRNLQLTTGTGNVGAVVNSAGNLGIGTASPTARLDARYASFAMANYPLFVGNSSYSYTHVNYDTAVIQQDDVTTLRMVEYNNGGTNQELGIEVGDGYSNFTSSVPMRFWGTASPGGLIYNGASGALALTITGANATFSQPVTVGTPTAVSHATTKSYVDSMFSGSGQWTTNGGLVYLTSTTQNVGIGTTSPGAKLEVNGDVMIKNSAGTGGINIVDDGGTNQRIAHSGSKFYIGKTGNQLVSFVQIDGTSANTQHLYIPSGNVGIGTVSPGNKLEIYGSSNGLLMKLNIGGVNVAQIGSEGGVGAFDLEAHGSPILMAKPGTYGVAFGQGVTWSDLPTNGNMNLKGNVGIGTTNPQYKIDMPINGKIGTYSDASHNASIEFYNSTTANMNFQLTNASGGSYTFSGGNVGIATTTPVYKLDVVGTSQFSQPVIVGTPTANSHATTKSYVDSMFTGSGQWTTNGGLVYLTSTTQNVGIGTTSPGAKLEVNGDVMIKNSAGTGGINIVDDGGTNQRIAHSGSKFYIGKTGNQLVSFVQIDGTSANTQHLYIPSGNVGIGTVSPGNKLEIYGSSNGLLMKLNIGGVNVAQIGSEGGVGAFDLEAHGSPILMAKPGTYGVAFGQGVTWSDLPTNGNMNLKGNVGIGTTNPQYKIDMPINGKIGTYSDASHNASIEFYNSTTANMNFQLTNASGGSYTFSGGNVGIATTTPVYKLDVVGTSQFSQPVIVGTPTANSHATTKSYVDSMFTGSGQWTTNGGLVYLTSTTQNVGIGTTSPSNKFTVGVADNSTTQASGGAVLNIFNSNTTANNYASIAFGQSGAGSNSFSRIGVQYIDRTGGSEDQDIFFSTIGGGAYNERMRILSTGNVGVGTTSPGNKFEVVGGNIALYESANIERKILVYRSGVIVGGLTSANGAMTLESGNSKDIYITPSSPGNVLINSGNVGISTTTPSYNLDVAGYGRFTQPVLVGTPTASGHAATKSYVDSIVGGGAGSGSFTTLTVTGTSTLSGNLWLTGAMYSNLNMNGKNITGINKLTVSTIDPLYEIEGKKYSTYASAIAGGVKEEYVGRGKLEQIAIGNWQMAIDFSKVERGSDLWVWYKAIEFSKDNVEVLATAYDVPISIAYTIEGQKIIFKANNKERMANGEIEFSYRLVGKRFDWRKWPTYAKDQSETPSLIVK